MLHQVTWGHVTLSAGEYVMSWPILIVTIQFSLHIWLSYNTELKTFVTFIYFDSFAIVII